MKKKLSKIISYIILIVSLIIFLPVILFNVVIIIKGVLNPDKIPTMFGYAPLIVQTGQMSPRMEHGDLAFTKEVDAKTLKVGDVIGVYEKKGIVEIKIITEIDDDGTFTVKDDNYTSSITSNDIVGKYVYRIKGLGQVLMFMQTPIGMVFFIVVPCAIVMLVYTISKKDEIDNTRRKNKRLEREIETLKKKN